MIKFPGFMFLSNSGISGTIKLLDILIDMLTDIIFSFMLNFKAKYMIIEQTSVGLDLWGMELGALNGKISDLRAEKDNMGTDENTKLIFLLLFLLLRKNILFISKNLPLNIDNNFISLLKKYNKDYYVDFFRDISGKTNVKDFYILIKKYFIKDLEIDEQFFSEIENLSISEFLEKLTL